MRWRWRLLKIWCLGVILCGVQMLGGLAEAADGEPITDARAYLTKVHEVMAGLTSYHSAMLVNIRSPLGDASVVGEGDFLLKPELKYRNTFHCVLTDLSGNQAKLDMTQYVEQVGDHLTTYSSEGDAWRKRTVAIAGMRLPYDLNAAMKLVKSVEIEEQTPAQIVLAVTIDSKAIGEMTLRMMEQGTPRGLGLEKEQAKAAFARIGDVVYRFQIDKATHYVTSVHTDMSDTIRSFLGAVLDTTHAEPQGRANLDALIQGIEMVAAFDNSAFDQVERFEVPRNIVKNAVDTPKDVLPDAAAIGVIVGQDAGKKAN